MVAAGLDVPPSPRAISIWKKNCYPCCFFQGILLLPSKETGSNRMKNRIAMVKKR